jgi:hypothetical protein
MMQAHQEQYIPLSIFADNPIRLVDPENYPNSAWFEQTAHYDRMWSYYKGYILNKKASNGAELYPVKLNIVRSAVINHAAVLLGQFQDDQVVQFGVRSNPVIDKEVALAVTKATNILWTINKGGRTMLEQALFQQIFGGCFWQVSWNPTRLKWPIRYFSIDPRACFPVWEGNDYDRLVSMDTNYQIPKPTAVARYGLPLDKFTAYAKSPDYVTIHEHWDEKEFFIKIDDEIGRWPDGKEMKGDNPFYDPVLGHTIVPFVYAPRLRVGEYFGESLVTGLIGPQNSINNNLAHLEEGLADAMHQKPWVRNRTKGAEGLDKGSRSEFINLGMGQPGQKDPPEVGRLEGAELTDPMIDLVTEDLVKLSREHTNLPDVAYGRTDASIRSALTLRYMMWPTTNVGLHYRLNMSGGLKNLNYYAFVIALSKRKFGSDLNGVGSLGIDAVNEQMLEAILLGYKTHWAPMLPDDREGVVNEMVQRVGTELISRETAIRRLDGDDDLEEELDRIEEQKQAEQEAMMKQAEAQAATQDEFAASADERKADLQIKVNKAKPQPKDQTTKAQAKGGRAKNGGK